MRHRPQLRRKRTFAYELTAEQHTPPVNPVLFYYPDGYWVLRSDLKGRDSAGESFLSAFITQTVHSEVLRQNRWVEEGKISGSS